MAKKEEKVKEFHLSVSYPLNLHKDLDRVISKVGKELSFVCDGSGAGFGQRDLELYFTGTKTQFQERLKIFKASLKDTSVTFSK